jgi:HK97 family phage portal protein
MTLGLITDYEWRREEDLARLHREALRDHEARDIQYEQFQGMGLVSPPSTAGIAVTPLSAYQVSAWWCGINVIAGDIGVLDFDLFRRVGEDDREKVKNHPVAKVLDQPNEFMVPKVFWQTLLAHALGWGNAYAEIEYDNSLRPIALWPILPNEIEPVAYARLQNGRKSTAIGYRYRGREPLIPAEDILHIPGLGFDGIRGYSVVSLARQSLGLAMAAERFEGAFFGNGTWTGMVLEHPSQLSDGALARMKTSVEQLHKGAENAFKLFVAEEGMKVGRPVTTSPKDAQADQIRDRQVEEIARWLNIPPHKLKHAMGERPGNNLEASETDYHITTLLPWTTLIAQICNRKLISAAQRGTYYTEHDFRRRLQPTPKERLEIQLGYLEAGVMDADQIARQENLPKPKPKAADVPPTPPPPPPPVPTPTSPSADAPTRDHDRLARATLGVAMDAVGRYSRRESAAATRAAKKGAAAFQAWAEAFYRDELPVLRGSLLPAVRLSLACRGLGGDADAISDRLAKRYLERSKEELLGLPAKDLDARTADLVARWETGRAADLADEILAIPSTETRGESGAPTVNVTVNVPEQAPAQVNVTVPPAEVRIEVPTPSVQVDVAVPAPNVQVDVENHIPPQLPPTIENHLPAPVIRVDAPVTVHVPPAVPLDVVRDRDGDITGLRPAR